MSALNALKFAVNRLTEEQAARVLASAGIRFRVGTQWVEYDEEGQLVNSDGQRVTAGVSAFTGIEVGGERRTANGIVRGTEMQPTPGAAGSAGFIPEGGTEQGRQMVNVGTGETMRVEVDPRNPGIRRTVAAAPTDAAARHANALQRPPVPGAREPVELNPNSGPERSEPQGEKPQVEEPQGEEPQGQGEEPQGQGEEPQVPDSEKTPEEGGPVDPNQGGHQA